MEMFKGTNIKQKLLRMNLLSIGVAFLLIMALQFVKELGHFQKFVVENLSAQARIVGNNSTAAISFSDQKAAEEILSSLKDINNIIQAVIYTTEGDIFAQYIREGTKVGTSRIPKQYGYKFEGRYFSLSQPIILSSETIGTIYLRSDIKELYLGLVLDLVLLFSVALASLIIASLLFSRLQRSITGPIFEMVGTMQEVSKKKDYSLRASISSKDELGLLASGFNEMLTQIQKWDHELSLHYQQLEDLVASRTSQLRDTNQKLQEELIVRSKIEEELRRYREELEKLIEERTAELIKTNEELRGEISEREKVEKALRDSEEKLTLEFHNVARAKKEWESTFDGITAPLFLHDKEFRILRANRAYTEIAGMSFKEILGRPYYEVFPKMDSPFKTCSGGAELSEKSSTHTENIYISSIDKIFMMRFYTVNDVNGDYLYSIHILEDITEMRRAEEKIRQEIEITTNLLSIAEATAHTTDIDKLMEQVVHSSHRIMGSDISLSYLYERETKVFRPSQCCGLSREIIPLFMTELLDEKLEFITLALEKGIPLVAKLDNKGGGNPHSLIAAPFTYAASTDIKPVATKPIPWIKDINTIVAIPLIRRTGYLGFLINIYTKPGEFTERHKKIVEGIAQEVSLALEVAYSYRASIEKAMELAHKIETIQVMNEIDRSILSTFNSQEILETTVRLVTRLIPCDMGNVFLVDRERGGFLFQAGFGTDLSRGSFIPFTDTSITELVNTGRSLYTSSLSEEQSLLPLEKRLLELGFLSHIRVPLVLKGNVTGILHVGAKRPAFFTPNDLSTLEKLAYQIGVALENARLLTDLQELFLGTVKSLASAIDAKSPWTAGHSERVTKYAIAIGKAMGFPEKDLNDLELAALLHDIGKIGIYDAILDKPEKLTDEEYAIIKRHPAKGAELLKPIKQLKHIIPWIRHHHEGYNGTGYPEGLKEDEIPLMARILTVSDSFDAMTSKRPYRDALSREKVIEEMKRCSGTQFDQKVVEVFLKVLESGQA